MHHLPESYMNSYIRCKLALIEDEPTIKLYDEQLWASSLTYGRTPVEVSLDLLRAVHELWTILLGGLELGQ